MLEAESEAEDKSPRPRTKFWPRGQLGLEDLTSLHSAVASEALAEQVSSIKQVSF